jgi:hypothetical protein
MLGVSSIAVENMVLLDDMVDYVGGIGVINQNTKRIEKRRRLWMGREEGYCFSCQPGPLRSFNISFP